MTLALQNFATYSLQVALLVALGGLLPLVFRLKSVKARLAWWQMLLAACVVLPLVQPWKQMVEDAAVSITTSEIVIGSMPAHTVARPFPWAAVVLGAILFGIAARLVWLGIGFRRLRGYLNASTLYVCPLARSTEVHAYVGLSEEVSSPVTFGWRRPVILFPARFAEMTAAMQESIACHELLHVERRDWLFMLAEELIRAALWFHPAIWWLLGEIQLTREQVVDREVVQLTRARETYLNALVEIASARTRLDLAPAPLFLHKRHLSQRVAQILKEVTMSRTRIAASLTGISVVTLTAGWLMVHSFPLQAAPQERPAAKRADAAGVTVEQAEANLLHRAPVEYPEAARTKGIQGTVLLEVDIDESGNVSDARVLSGPQELRKAALQSVLQWHYSKNMSLPAKTQVSVDFKLPLPAAAGSMPKPAREAVVLPSPVIEAPVNSPSLGTLRLIDLSSLPESLRTALQEKIGKYEGQPYSNELMQEVVRVASQVDQHLMYNWAVEPTAAGEPRFFRLRVMLNAEPASTAVWSKDAPAASTSDSGTPQRIRVGGNVQQTNLISQTRPAYPPLAKQARIQGLVRLNAIIAKDGTVANLTVIAGHPLLVEAALEAVRQWIYKTTLLNGEPVEVQTVIDVNFTLSQ